MSEALTIQELPLIMEGATPEAHEGVLTIETIQEAIEPPTPDPQRKTPVTFDESVPAPKKKGRPPGSKSKIPGKPRARKVKLEPVEVIPDELPLRDSRPVPTVSQDSTSARMLALLTEHAKKRQTRKTDLYNSWFR